MCTKERITGEYQCKYMDLSIAWAILFILVIGSALSLIVTIVVMGLSLKKPNLQIPCKVLSVLTRKYIFKCITNNVIIINKLYE